MERAGVRATLTKEGELLVLMREKVIEAWTAYCDIVPSSAFYQELVVSTVRDRKTSFY